MQVYGHRGAAGEAPENTIAGARHAITRGVRQVEIDLRLSADKQLVIVHDNTALRTAGVKRQITRMTAKQLSQLDARAFGTPWPRKAGCGIPTLKQFMRRCPEIRHYQLEVKSDETTDKPVLIKKLGEQFPNRAATKNIVVTSFDYAFLEQLNQQLPHIPIGAISYKRPAFKVARDLGCDYFCIHESIATPAFVEKIQRSNMHLSIWTVNNPVTIKRFYKMGVDSVITDYPSMAIPLVKSLMR